MIEVGVLEPGDRERWEELARGYHAFYETELPDSSYEECWQRLTGAVTGFYALGARLDGELVGITHYFFHHAFWFGKTCYLQDLFTAPHARGRGAARALIERVADGAREQGAFRLYWHTRETNVTARLLYDKVARFSGFIRYERAL